MNAEREPDTATHKTLVSLTGDGQPPLAVAQQSQRMRKIPRASPDSIPCVRSRNLQCPPTVSAMDRLQSPHTPQPSQYIRPDPP